MEQRVLLLESMQADFKANTETTVADVLAKVNKVQEMTTQLGDGLETVTADMVKYTSGLGGEKVRLMADLNAEFDRHKLALASVTNSAREEFGNIKDHITGLHAQTAQAFVEVKTKVDQLEAEIQRGNLGKGPKEPATHGYLPMKSLVPAAFGNSEDQWRGWQDDVMDYIESQKAGMKAVLKAAEKESGALDEDWMRDMILQYSVNAVGERANLYRALKALTTGEARTVVQGVRDENGYAAWKALHQRFGPSVAARQGKVMCDLSQMVVKPAKSPAETRTLVTELERRIRIAEDVTGNVLSDSHIKAILASILDPTTRAHTSAHQGVQSSYQDLKRAVLEFANNNVASRHDGPEPMQIGKCCEDPEPPTWADALAQECEHWEVVGDQQQLAVVSAQTQCYNCGGFGHLAGTCSSLKGKGKGLPAKGGPKGGAPKGASPKGGKGAKGSPKGGKKGPVNGCWTCGGPHFASECTAYPSNAGKGGKAGKGFNMVDHHWPEPAGKQLCSLRTIAPEQWATHVLPKKTMTKVANRFEALSSEEELEQEEPRQQPVEPMKSTLADFIVQKKQEEKPRKVDEGVERPTASGWLRPLATIEPEGLNPVVDAPQWEEISLAVDSGASETVIPEGTVKAAKLVQSEGSRRGVEYEVANGHRIPNLGQKTFKGLTEENLLRGITAQVADVNKPLLSVAKLVKSGNTVVFSPDGAYVEDNETRERMWLTEAGGMYHLRMWVPAEVF